MPRALHNPRRNLFRPLEFRDALVVVEHGEEGPANSTRIIAYRIGLIAAGGGLLLLPNQIGWTATFAVGAALMAMMAGGVFACPRVEVPLEARRDVWGAFRRTLFSGSAPHGGGGDVRLVGPTLRAGAGGVPGTVVPGSQVLAGRRPGRQRVRRPESGLRLRPGGSVRVARRDPSTLTPGN